MTLIEYIKLSSFNIGALMLAASCMVYVIIRRNIGRTHNKIYIMAIGSLIMTAAFNMLAIAFEPYLFTMKSAPFFYESFHTLYFVVHNMLSLFVCYYAIFATEMYLTISIPKHVFYITPFIVSEVLIILNPFTHWAFTYDSEYNFVRGWGIGAFYLTGAIALIVAMYYFMFRWHAITMRKRHLLGVSFVVCITGLIVQLYDARIEAELLAEAIAFMGIMLAVEYDDDSIDGMTGIYNRQTLLHELQNFFDIEKPFALTVIRVGEDGWYHSYDTDTYIIDLSDYLRTIHKLHLIYRANANSIVLLSYKGEEKEYIPLISEWVINRGGAMKTVILKAEAPKNILKIEDAILMFEGALPSGTKNGEILEGNGISFLQKSFEVNRALEYAIANNGLEVCYQPIFEKDASSGKWVMKGAEALVRLHDEKLGDLLPGAFIPAAERNGSIGALGEFVLRDALSFIESGDCGRAGIDYININLSEVQCMKSDFAERICAIAGNYMASPERIRFELEESILNENNTALPDTIGKLKNFGFMFVVENFGTGRGEILTSYFKYFDYIKLDKKMLWNSDRSRSGKIVLENCIKMLHGINKKVIAIGVETKDHVETLDKCGIEAMQGFYYSRPVTRNALAGRRE